MKIIRGDTIDNSSDINWELAWKVTAPQRVRMFIWLSLHNHNLTNAIWVIRHLSNDPRCKYCNSPNEDLDHILRRCPPALRFWNEFGLAQDDKFMGTPLNEWILNNIDSANPDRNE